MALDASQFEQMFNLHYTMLCNVANNIVRDRDAAEDIVQELFASVWRKRDQLDLSLNFKGYLLRSVSNASLNYLESNKRKTSLGINENRLEEGNAETLSAIELKKQVRKALDGLPPRCRTIFVLSRIYDMKYREIAAHLNISVKTVENQMGIALEKMREQLRPFVDSNIIGISIQTGLSVIVLLLTGFYCG
ncbi:MAG TPA: RNA polymerase sigma-70 factor [Flavobacteriales bacterium]|nr:RNA polymerase sigma-70 factor [Flavobacteriales bacterium]